MEADLGPVAPVWWMTRDNRGEIQAWTLAPGQRVRDSSELTTSTQVKDSVQPFV